MSSERPPGSPPSPAPDCRSCGACCRDAADGRVPVTEADILRWRRTGNTTVVDTLVPGHFGQLGMPADARGTCLHLDAVGGVATCRIYATRGEACRALEAGSPQCLAYRRVAGLEPR